MQQILITIKPVQCILIRKQFYVLNQIISRSLRQLGKCDCRHIGSFVTKSAYSPEHKSSSDS